MHDAIWHPEWNTGITSIDDQHRELFKQVGVLMTAVSNNSVPTIVSDTLLFLGQYVDDHFSEEEEIMKRLQYPWFSDHKNAHDKMLTDVKNMISEYHSNRIVISDKIIDFMIEWLINHINGHDRQMAVYIKNNGDRL